MDKPNRIIYKKMIREKFPWYRRIDLELRKAPKIFESEIEDKKSKRDL